MDSSYDGSSSDEEGTMNNNENKKPYHRHTDHQIQTLEAYFKETNTHPDISEQLKLSEALNLKPSQVRFWFQNKRTKVKAETEKVGNAALRAENTKLRREIEAMKEINFEVCLQGGGCGPRPDEELERMIQDLRFENAVLKQEYERLESGLITYGGYTRASLASLLNLQGPSSYPSTSNTRHPSYGPSSNHLGPLEPQRLLRGPSTHQSNNINQPPQPVTLLQPRHFQPLSQVEKTLMSEMAANAVAEVIGLIKMGNPMWTNSSIDGRLVIDEDIYVKMFAEISRLKIPNCRYESSREVVEVPIDARNLIDVFSNTDKWERLFSTVVTKANTIQELESMDGESKSFTKLIYEELHILSPLEPPREFIILRSCRKIQENLWVIADVSCHIQNGDFDSTTLTCAKRPSGCIIQALPDGSSKVMWMEHVEVANKVPMHQLFKNLICSGSGYGARRWTITLVRMCERLFLSSTSFFSLTDYDEVVKSIEGRMNIMKLGERMLKNFASLLKMSDNFEFSPETNNSGVRISVRTNTELGVPYGLIVCGCLSLSIPLPPHHIYYFLTNSEIRHQWDVLCNGNRVTEVARFVTGTDHRNCVTILQPSSTTENNEMMLLQDSFIDDLGGMVVYSPVDLKQAYTPVSGKIVDSSCIPILPFGFIISSGDHPSAPNLDSGTTILTVAVQNLVSGPHSSGDSRESIVRVNSLISSTIGKIKAMLTCHQDKLGT